MRRMRVVGPALPVLLVGAVSTAARADDIQDLKRSQEELRKIVENQQKEIDRLRASGRGGADGDLATMIEELSKRPDNSGPMTWKQFTRAGSKVTIYGFIRLDMHRDGSRMNNVQLPAWVRSEDDDAPASIGAPSNHTDFSMHPKLTRLGFDFDGPVIESLWSAKVTGKLETDFYNATGTNSRAALRMRHAYLKLSWCNGEETLLVGQTQDLISPLNPVVNNDFVMWGAGNLGDRRPQVRFDWNSGVADGTTLIVQAMAGDTGAVDGKDLDPAGTTGAGYLDGQMSGNPTWQGRVALRTKNWDDKDVEIGLWGHTASEQADADIGTKGKASFRSHAAGIDVKVPLLGDDLWIMGEAWQGQDLTDVRGGILQGVNVVTGEEIDSRGGFVELGFKPCSWATTYVGYSTDNPSDGDLSQGGAEGGRSLNRIWYLAARLNFNPVEVGLDFLHWRTKFIGFGDGVNNRVGAFVAYKF